MGKWKDFYLNKEKEVLESRRKKMVNDYNTEVDTYNSISQDFIKLFLQGPPIHYSWVTINGEKEIFWPISPLSASRTNDAHIGIIEYGRFTNSSGVDLHVLHIDMSDIETYSTGIVRKDSFTPSYDQLVSLNDEIKLTK